MSSINPERIRSAKRLLFLLAWGLIGPVGSFAEFARSPRAVQAIHQRFPKPKIHPWFKIFRFQVVLSENKVPQSRGLLYALSYVLVKWAMARGRISGPTYEFLAIPCIRPKRWFDQTRFRRAADSLKLVAPLIAREAGEPCWEVGQVGIGMVSVWAEISDFSNHKSCRPIPRAPTWRIRGSYNWRNPPKNTNHCYTNILTASSKSLFSLAIFPFFAREICEITIFVADVSVVSHFLVRSHAFDK